MHNTNQNTIILCEKITTALEDTCMFASWEISLLKPTINIRNGNEKWLVGTVQLVCFGSY